MKKMVVVALMAIWTAVSLCACGSAAQTASETQTEAESTEVQEITITFMNGEEELGSIKAKDGQIIEETEYSAFENRENTEFLGWYETPTFLASSQKDLKTDTFNKDTTLYGSFRSAEVAEDTRLWYIAGTSSAGSLKDNNWAGAGTDEAVKEQFLLQPTGNMVNEFAITLDLYAGDEFQIIHDWAWDGQKGYGCFTQIDNTQMENNGGLGGSADMSNVKVLMDGNYTITLTTNPDNPALDTLSIERNGDAAEVQ